MADLVVIGAGHAGCEAALAAARMGIDTLLLTLNMDGVALMACNPVIGGSAKGHLVRELDALGGEMGLAIDDTFLQSRMLNTGKGPAVHSLRAQADKQAYQNRMRRALMTTDRLTVRQGEAASIETENGRVTAVTTVTGARIPCRAVVAATGVYLQGSIVIGEHRHAGGLNRHGGRIPPGEDGAELHVPRRRHGVLHAPAQVAVSHDPYSDCHRNPPFLSLEAKMNDSSRFPALKS